MQINYLASKTASEFHKSTKIVRGLRGPVGCGKSVACILEIVRMACAQEPNIDGIRKTRFAIIRNTNPELRTTTLNTWKAWLPERVCPIKLHPFIHGTLRLPQPDGTRVECEVYFLALDRPDDVKKLLSLEVTGVFINEAREINYAVVKAARERIGRYPAAIDGYENDRPCTRKALIMDTNPPDTDHWWYQLAEDGALKGAQDKELAREQIENVFDFFKYPAPLIKQANGTYLPNPEAENIEHLDGGYDYYLDMLAGNTEEHINVQVLGNYGTIQDGKPVYQEYNDQVHCFEGHLMPIRGLPICLGWDFGLSPSVVIGQMTELGQIRIIQELVAEDMDVAQFARDIVKPYLQKHFKDYTIGFSYADPAGNARGEGEGKSAIGILNDQYIRSDEVRINAEGEEYIVMGDEPLNMGFWTEVAPTNDITLRLSAVRSFLMKLVGRAEPGFIIAKRCVILRKGFQGGYKYKRYQIGGANARFADKPDKDKYSHPHDALQYLALGFQGGFVQEPNEYEQYDESVNLNIGYWN